MIIIGQSYLAFLQEMKAIYYQMIKNKGGRRE